MAKKVTPIEGILSTLETMKEIAMTGDSSIRAGALRHEIQEPDIIIDTCVAHDTGEWETGIAKNQHWIIVEQYSTKKKAEAGHNKWVKAMTENHDLELTDINVWDL